MTKFIAIKINYDDRKMPAESKYTVEPTSEDYEQFVDRFQNRNQGGDGFHECLNFEKNDTSPVRFYLPPNSIPKDDEEDYVVFSFTYKSDPSKPSVVLGVHAGAKLVAKDGLKRPGTRPIPGHGNLTFHMESDPDFVTLFSTPLPYDSNDGRYTPLKWIAEKWRLGIEIIAICDPIARSETNHLSRSSVGHRTAARVEPFTRGTEHLADPTSGLAHSRSERPQNGISLGGNITAGAPDGFC